MNPRFYHLDTCFCPLEGGWLVYYPQAFDAYSNRLIEQRVPAGKRLPVSEADAVRFACNAVNVGRHIFVNQMSVELRGRLEAAGFAVVETPLNEFIKSGGAVVDAREEDDAKLKPVTQAGVAPDDFLSTTIYPTEARVRGQWWRVQDQRMDGVILIDENQQAARCTLFRYLKPGDLVVVGSKGVRTLRKTESRGVRGGARGT